MAGRRRTRRATVPPVPRLSGRAQGRRSSPRLASMVGGRRRAPQRCPDCDARLVEDEGRRQQRHGGFSRKVDAQEELTRIISEHRAGRDPTSAELTLSDWFERWLDIIAASVRVGELSPKTAAGYESHVRNHLRPRVGHIDVRKLTPGEVADLLRDIQASGRSPATAARVRATLSRSLSDAMRHELVHRNVAQIAKAAEDAQARASAFTRDEFERILEVLSDHRLGPASFSPHGRGSARRAPRAPLARRRPRTRDVPGPPRPAPDPQGGRAGRAGDRPDREQAQDA